MFKDRLIGNAFLVANAANELPSVLAVKEGDIEVDLAGSIPSITFSQRLKNLMANCMKYAVFVKLLGRFIRQDVLYTKICSLWKPSGGIKLTELEGGCYMVKLDNEGDYQNAMLGGPWVVLGHYLIVHPWDPCISPTNLEIKRVYGWVRLPGLPYHCYHKSVLRAIGEVIGKVLKIDYNTESFEKARFARLAVKLDLTKPLVSRIQLDGVSQFVEYEGLPTICYGCGRYGHLEEACPFKVHQPSASSKTSANPQVIPQSPALVDGKEHGGQARGEHMYDEWIKVAPRNGRLPRAVRKDGQGPSYSGERRSNRFNLLASLDNADMHQNGKPHMVGDKHIPSDIAASTKAKKQEPNQRSTLDKAKLLGHRPRNRPR